MKQNIEKPTYVNKYVHMGVGSKIWRYCNIYGTEEAPVLIGDETQIGSYCEIKPGVDIGSHCRLQSGIFIPDGVTIDDFVFIGPNVTFTNDKYPDIVKTENKIWDIKKTTIDKYVSIGAGSVINPGLTIKNYAQIGSGAVVTKDVDPFAIVVGNPAKKIGDIRKKTEHYDVLLQVAKKRGDIK